MRRIAHIAEILLVQRLIQMINAVQVGFDLWRNLAVLVERATRCGTHHKKRQRNDDEQRRNRNQQAAEKILEHKQTFNSLKIMMIEFELRRGEDG